jgi:hypothetical protein
MAKSPFSSAGGGSADTSPYSEARSRGGRACRANGGSVKGGDLAALEKAEASPNPKTRKAAMKAEKK